MVVLVGLGRDLSGAKPRVCGVASHWAPHFLAAGDGFGGGCDVVLVEADGSRRLPLKCPAAHEPVLPRGMSHCVAVAGLDALGAPLEEGGAVFRAPEVAAVTGLMLGSKLTAEAMAACVAQRAVWGVTDDGVVFVACVNKVDNAELALKAREVARCAVQYAPDLVILAGEGADGRRGCVWS